MRQGFKAFILYNVRYQTLTYRTLALVLTSWFVCWREGASSSSAFRGERPLRCGLIWSEIITLSPKILASLAVPWSILLIRTQLSSSESEMKYGNNKCMEQGTSREENAAAAPYAAGKQVGRRRKGPANKHESSSSEREGRATQALPIAICHLVDASLSLRLRPWLIRPRLPTASAAATSCCERDVRPAAAG